MSLLTTDLPSHNARHIFYHHSHCLPVFHPASLRQTSLFEYHGSQEPSPLLGYRLALAGSHSLSFDLPLPLSNFPRGPFRSSRGAIKYILIASLKLFFPATGKKSIAHFYRHITVYPFLEIDKVLLNYGDPIEVSRESKLGWKWAGGEGRVGLNVKAARKIWVAGQQCWIDVAIRNESSKKARSPLLCRSRSLGGERLLTRLLSSCFTDQEPSSLTLPDHDLLSSGPDRCDPLLSRGPRRRADHVAKEEGVRVDARGGPGWRERLHLGSRLVARL